MDRRRTYNLSDPVLQQLAIADVSGWPVNGSGNREQFDLAKRYEARQRQLAQRMELRDFLLELFGDEHFHATMDLFVELSTRQIDPDPSKAHRRKAAERPLLKRMILLGLFRSDRPINEVLRANLEQCRIEDMAEAAVANIGRSKWTIVSPRTARAIRNADLWSVQIEGRQAVYQSLSKDDTSEFIRDQATVLFEEDGAYLSRWHQGRRTVLEVVKLFPDLESARAFAKTSGERWITNVKTQQTIDAGSEAA
jgi:hypothetical protein